MTDLAHIGKRVRTIREAQRPRVSQETLARELGVSWITISRLERGVGKKLDLDRLHNVADALGVTVDQLLEDAA